MCPSKLQEQRLLQDCCLTDWQQGGNGAVPAYCAVGGRWVGTRAVDEAGHRGRSEVVRSRDEQRLRSPHR